MIYNHAIAKENLFERDADYQYFLNKLKEHLLPVCDVLSYCLMPNHYHLLVKFKSEEELINFFQSKLKSRFTVKELIEQKDNYLGKQLSQCFSNFFNTYSKHFNFVKSRTGTLFKRTFRRKNLADITYLQNLVCYLHQNPVESNFAESITAWKYSSYNTLISDKPTLLNRQYILDLFDGLENFKFCHLKNVEIDI